MWSFWNQHYKALAMAAPPGAWVVAVSESEAGTIRKAAKRLGKQINTIVCNRDGDIKQAIMQEWDGKGPIVFSPRWVMTFYTIAPDSISKTLKKVLALPKVESSNDDYLQDIIRAVGGGDYWEQD